MTTIGRLFCRISIHRWSRWQEWEPSFDAPIVTRMAFVSRCERCGKQDVWEARFDPITGDSVT